MWSIKLLVRDVVLSMLAKTADILSQKFRNIKEISPMGQHLDESCGTTHNFEWEILDAFRVVNRLMIKKEVHQKAETATKHAR